jgi:hypothetical protein
VEPVPFGSLPQVGKATTSFVDCSWGREKHASSRQVELDDDDPFRSDLPR